MEWSLVAQSGRSLDTDGILIPRFVFGNGLARELELLPVAQGMQSYLRRAV